MILKDSINTGYTSRGLYSNILPRVASLNASDDYINTGIDLSGSAQVDITMTYYRASARTIGGSAQGQNANYRFGIVWNSDNKIYALACAGSSGSTAVTAAITSTGWFTLRLVYDGTQGTNATKLKVYLNGVQQ